MHCLLHRLTSRTNYDDTCSKWLALYCCLQATDLEDFPELRIEGNNLSQIGNTQYAQKRCFTFQFKKSVDINFLLSDCIPLKYCYSSFFVVLYYCGACFVLDPIALHSEHCMNSKNIFMITAKDCFLWLSVL